LEGVEAEAKEVKIWKARKVAFDMWGRDTFPPIEEHGKNRSQNIFQLVRRSSPLLISDAYPSHTQTQDSYRRRRYDRGVEVEENAHGKECQDN